MSLLTTLCIEWFLLPHNADVPAFPQWLYRSSAGEDYADQVWLCSHLIFTCGTSFIKAIPTCSSQVVLQCCVFPGLCTHNCQVHVSWQSVFVHRGLVLGLCLLWDRAPASLMMVVTLQVPWVMSLLEEIINQVNDWQVNYSQQSECISLLEAPAGIQVLCKPGPQFHSAFSFSLWALYNLPHSSHMHLHSPTEMINPQLEELF